MIYIPSRETKQLVQSNRSKIFGNIWSSFNLDLKSSLGLIRVSPRLRVNTSGVTNQGISVAFRNYDQRIFTIAGTRIFKNTTTNDLTTAFVEDASTGAKTDYDPNYSDMEFFNSVLCATTPTKLVSKAEDGSGTGAWTERATLTTSTSLHKLHYFRKYDRLYFIDEFKKIKSIDTSWSVATSGSDYAIDLTYNNGVPYCLASDSNDIWIGTIIQNNASIVNNFQGASILRWDGIDSQITAEYRIKAQGVLALCKDDKGLMHAIDTNGSLIAFNGDGFSEIGRLPVNKNILANATTGLYNSFIHPNGFTYSKNGTFLVLVNNLNGDNGSTINENLPSGIWEWSSETGFVHRQSVTYNTLANSTITDYGQNRVSRVGALYEPNIYNSGSGGKPTLICGVTYYTDASSTTSGIFVDDPNDTIQKYGYLVTSWILSQNIKDTWNNVYSRHKSLLDSSDRIVMKYRTREESATEASITWTLTNAFTTTTDLSGMVGYEVEVIQGTGSGKCAHITAVTGSGTYTITLDEDFTGVSGTAKVRVQNWTKSGVVSSQSDEFYKFTIGKTSERVQIKCCVLFTGEDELYELALSNVVHTELK